MPPDPRPGRLRPALVLLTLVVVVPAGLAVWLIVAEEMAMRRYGDQPPPGGYATIAGVLLLVLLSVPAVLVAEGWLLRRRAPRAAVVVTVLAGLWQAGLGFLLGRAGGAGTTSWLLGVGCALPGLLVVGLALAAGRPVRRPAPDGSAGGR